ncbi:uncharacterized protein RBU57_016541 [Macrochelys suwanniensis]
MPRSPGFKPCSACLKPMATGDPHESCLKCLGESHQLDKCRICKAFKPQTKKERDFRLQQLLLEAALSPMSSTSLAWSAPAAPERPDTGKYSWNRTTPALLPVRRCSLSPGPKKQATAPAPPPPSLEPQPVLDRLAKAPTPAPSTPAPQGLSSFVTVSSPVHTAVELTLPSTLETFSTACDLIALTESAPPQPPVPPVRAVPSKGKPSMMRPPSRSMAGRHRSRSRSRSWFPSQSRRRSRSWHRSLSRHHSTPRRSTSWYGRRRDNSRHRSQSWCRSKHRSPRSRSRRRSTRRSSSRSRSGSRHLHARRYRSRSWYRSRQQSPSPRRSMVPRANTTQEYSAPPWPSRSASRSSQVESGYHVQGPGDGGS